MIDITHPCNSSHCLPGSVKATLALHHLKQELEEKASLKPLLKDEVEDNTWIVILYLGSLPVRLSSCKPIRLRAPPPPPRREVSLLISGQRKNWNFMLNPFLLSCAHRALLHLLLASAVSWLALKFGVERAIASGSSLHSRGAVEGFVTYLVFRELSLSLKPPSLHFYQFGQVHQ